MLPEPVVPGELEASGSALEHEHSKARTNGPGIKSFAVILSLVCIISIALAA
jgi:hypothetical protein